LGEARVDGLARVGIEVLLEELLPVEDQVLRLALLRPAPRIRELPEHHWVGRALAARRLNAQARRLDGSDVLVPLRDRRIVEVVRARAARDVARLEAVP
jgi:hypothetical protein